MVNTIAEIKNKSQRSERRAVARVCAARVAVKRRRGHRAPPRHSHARRSARARPPGQLTRARAPHLRSLLRPPLEAQALRSDGSGRPAPRSPRQYLNPPFLGRFAAVAGVGPVPPSLALPASLAYTYNQ